MRAVPIPGEILRTDVFLGLTFDELVTLGAAPLVIIFPSLFIDAIPLVATLGLAVVAALGVLGIVLQTPEGQTPLEWAPAAAKRRLSPDTYYLKPRHRHRDEIAHMDVVQTAERIAAESAPEAESTETAAADATVDESLSSVVSLGEESATETEDTQGHTAEREETAESEQVERESPVAVTD